MLHDGKVAIVTGAGSGIGRAIALRLAEEGASVVVCDRRRDAGIATVNLVHGSGHKGTFIEADVTIPADISGLVSQTLLAYPQIDVLVNNAAFSSRKTLLEMDIETWDRVMDVVLKGPFLLSQAVIPHMIARGGGSIINIASVSGMMAFGEEAYSAAKAGLINLTKNIAVRFGRDGIRANAICPGAVDTPAWSDLVQSDPGVFVRLAAKYPVGRIGRPQDVASAASYLASEDSDFITGTTLVLDGGLTAGMAGYTD